MLNNKAREITFNKLFPFFMSLLALMPAVAQSRISADVTIRQLNNKKVVRVEKSLFFSSNGNLVVHFTYPQEYYMVSNSLGETSVYQPAVNEVMQMNDKSFTSRSDIFALFLTQDFSELNLTQSGFLLKETKKEGDKVVRTYTPTMKEDKGISRVVVVLRNNQPIYCGYYNVKDKLMRKTYYSRYVTFPNYSFPTSITQISYDAKGDSVVRKEEYKNIKTSDFGADALFDWRVPKDARRVSPYDAKKK